MRVCPSIGWLDGPSIYWPISPSVRPSKMHSLNLQKFDILRIFNVRKWTRLNINVLLHPNNRHNDHHDNHSYFDDHNNKTKQRRHIFVCQKLFKGSCSRFYSPKKWVGQTWLSQWYHHSHRKRIRIRGKKHWIARYKIVRWISCAYFWGATSSSLVRKLIFVSRVQVKTHMKMAFLLVSYFIRPPIRPFAQMGLRAT